MRVRVVVVVGLCLALAAAACTADRADEHASPGTTAVAFPSDLVGTTPGETPESDHRDDIVFPLTGPLDLVQSSQIATLDQSQPTRPVLAMKGSSASFREVTAGSAGATLKAATLLSRWTLYFGHRAPVGVITWVGSDGQPRQATAKLATPHWDPGTTTMQYPFVAGSLSGDPIDGPLASPTMTVRRAGTAATAQAVSTPPPATTPSPSLAPAAASLAPRETAVPATATTDDQTASKPWVPEFLDRTGYSGFDDESSVVRRGGDCYVAGSPLLGPVTGTAGGVVRYSLATSVSDLVNSLGVSASASYKGGFFSGSAAATYLKSTEINDSSVYIVALSTVQLGSQAINYTGLTPKALALYESNYDEFVETCGNQYPANINLGGTYFAVFHIQATSQSDKTALTAEVTTKIGVSSFSSNLQKSITEVAGTREVKLFESMSGPTQIGWVAAGDADGVQKNMASFAEYAANKCGATGSADIKTCLQSMDFADNQTMAGSKAHASLDAYKAAAQQYEQYLVVYQGLIGEAANAAANPQLYEAAPGGDWATAIAQWTNALASVNDSLIACTLDIGSCAGRIAKLPNPATITGPKFKIELPESCEDLRKVDVQSGNETVYPPVGTPATATKDFSIEVFCDMKQTPALDYLILPNAANTSWATLHKQGAWTFGYPKVRIELPELQTVPSDCSYNTPTWQSDKTKTFYYAELGFSGTGTCMPWGVNSTIGDKKSDWKQSTAGVDLQGTHLYVSEIQTIDGQKDQFQCLGASGSVTAATPKSTNAGQTWTLTIDNESKDVARTVCGPVGNDDAAAAKNVLSTNPYIQLQSTPSG